MNVPVPGIGVAELVDALRSGGVIIDVREPDEYTQAHVPGAVLVPLQTIPSVATDLPTDEPVYIICHSGGRSHQAAAYVRQFDVQAINVLGGTQSWLGAGYPFITGPDAGAPLSAPSSVNPSNAHETP
jgi:rhodanese-related sulfurtransferase